MIMPWTMISQSGQKSGKGYLVKLIIYLVNILFLFSRGSDNGFLGIPPWILYFKEKSKTCTKILN